MAPLSSVAPHRVFRPANRLSLWRQNVASYIMLHDQSLSFRQKSCVPHGERLSLTMFLHKIPEEKYVQPHRPAAPERKNNERHVVLGSSAIPARAGAAQKMHSWRRSQKSSLLVTEGLPQAIPALPHIRRRRHGLSPMPMVPDKSLFARRRLPMSAPPAPTGRRTRN